MVQGVREVINKENPKFQNTPPFFSFSGWGGFSLLSRMFSGLQGKNLNGPVPILIGTQRRLFYSLQPFDFFIFKFSDIIMVIATMHNFSSRYKSGQNNRLLVNYFSVKLRIREFLIRFTHPRINSGATATNRAYQTQGCSRTNKFVPTEKVVHRICPSENRQMLLGYQPLHQWSIYWCGGQSILRKGGYHLNPKGDQNEK